MALTTYIELQAAIASRLHRSDLTTQIVDYITIAEKRLNRLLKLSQAETEVTLTATPSSRSLTLPSDFGTVIALYLTTYLPRTPLEFRLPEDMQVMDANGQSEYWTIDGAVIKTDTPADIAYTYTLRYKAAYDLASSSTNTLLTKYPDLYLYGSLVEAGADTKDGELVQMSAGRFNEALREVKDDINAARNLAPLTTELSGYARFNITNG
jgi:hypothetical protein